MKRKANKEKMKICLVGSSGGHLTHLYMLKPFWKDKDRFWVGMKFRCKITGEDGNTVYTNVVTAEKKNEIIIKNQPQDVKGEIGEKLTLDVQADGVTSYQWQYSTDGKNFYAWSWVAGYDKARMQFELTEGRNGMKFRCKLTGEDGKIVYTKTVSALHINYEEWETPIL